MISNREHQVAELIAWGASDKEVAHELNISWNTAKTHRHNIIVKIGGHNAADLTRWFFSRKMKQCFGLNPRQIRHIAVWLLLLIGVSEFIQTDMLRVRRAKVPGARVARPPRAGRAGKTLKLEYA